MNELESFTTIDKAYYCCSSAVREYHVYQDIAIGG